MTDTPPVIIVHGLWMPALVMGGLAHRVANCGFKTQTWSYPTVWCSLTENAQRLADFIRDSGFSALSIVAHSMGGLVALRMLELHPEIRCPRLVLAGTPYGDSFAARRLARIPGGEWLLGRSIAEWLREPRPGVCAENVGVIAGTRSLGLGWLVAPDLPKPHDGVVSVAETDLPAPFERILLPVGHSEMLFSAALVRQCCAFLRTGHFEVES